MHKYKKRSAITRDDWQERQDSGRAALPHGRSLPYRASNLNLETIESLCAEGNVLMSCAELFQKIEYLLVYAPVTLLLVYNPNLETIG